MNNFLKRIEQNLVMRSSRRRFVGKMGSVVASLAALITGQALWSKDTTDAAAANTKNRLRCCGGGTLCPDPEAQVCSNNTIPLYTWSCLDSKNNHNYTCTDCFQLIKTTPHKIYQYTCTFALRVPASQANQPAMNTSTSCQSSKANIVLE
jgi:hypothetical protein